METGWLLVEELMEQVDGDWLVAGRGVDGDWLVAGRRVDGVVDGTGRWSGTTIVAIVKSRW